MENQQSSLEQVLQRLQERERETIEGQLDALKTRYESLPKLVERTSQLTSIDPLQLVRTANQVSWITNMKWYEIIDILCTFYQYKKSADEQEEGQEGRP